MKKRQDLRTDAAGVKAAQEVELAKLELERSKLRSDDRKTVIAFISVLVAVLTSTASLYYTVRQSATADKRAQQDLQQRKFEDIQKQIAIKDPVIRIAAIESLSFLGRDRMGGTPMIGTDEEFGEVPFFRPASKILTSLIATEQDLTVVNAATQAEWDLLRFTEKKGYSRLAAWTLAHLADATYTAKRSLGTNLANYYSRKGIHWTTLAEKAVKPSAQEPNMSQVQAATTELSTVFSLPFQIGGTEGADYKRAYFSWLEWMYRDLPDLRSLPQQSAGGNIQSIDHAASRCESLRSLGGKAVTVLARLHPSTPTTVGGLDLSLQPLAGLDFTRFTFVECSMIHATLSRCKFDGAVFIGTVLDQANCEGASFKGCKLTGSSVSGTRLFGSTFDESVREAVSGEPRLQDSSGKVDLRLQSALSATGRSANPH